MSRGKDTAQDWFVGGRGKRLLLAALISEPGRAWTRAELARAAQIDPRGSYQRHVDVLLEVGLIVERDGRRLHLDEHHPLAPALAAFLQALDALGDVPLPPSRGGGHRR